MDECGISMDVTVNRKYGKSYTDIRVKEEGPYQRGEKWTLLLAICGEDAEEGRDSRRWASVWLDGGTTVTRFLEFVQEILDAIGPATNDSFFVFTMDNLNSHRNHAVIALIHLYGHGVVFHAPYWPVDGPIEFIFNTVQTLIRARLYQITSPEDLVQAIYQSVASIDSFASYFINCRFIL